MCCTIPLRIRTLISTGTSAPLRPEKAPSQIPGSFLCWRRTSRASPSQNKRFNPFSEAGPSFRLPQQVSADLSVYGARYTHWAVDNPRGWSGVRRNQAQFLVGVSF